MITVIYDKNGLAISDGNINTTVDDIVDSISENKDVELTIGTFLVIDEIRARIVEDRINNTKIQIKWNDEFIKFDVKGQLKEWPKDFGTSSERIFRRIIRGREKKRKGRK